MYHIGMTSAEQLLALINDTNSLALTFDDIQFGEPSVISEQEQSTMDDPANTRVLVIAKPNRYPIEYAEVVYDRIDLAQFATLDTPYIIVTDVENAPTFDIVLQAFNSYYHSNLTREDLDPEIPLPEIFVQDEPVVLVAAGHSLGYRGTLTLTITPGVRSLSDLLSNTELPGLVMGGQLNLLITNTDLPGLVIAE